MGRLFSAKAPSPLRERGLGVREPRRFPTPQQAPLLLTGLRKIAPSRPLTPTPLPKGRGDEGRGTAQ